MHIFGEKIILRAIEAKDNEMLRSLVNDPETEIMIGGSSWPVSKDEQMEWYERQKKEKNILRCIAASISTDEALGAVILSDIDSKNGTAEIHIKMDKESGRGKGYGTDALKTLCHYGFQELRLHCIYARVLSSNAISKKLFEKCGFEREGVLRARVYKGGKYHDYESYSLLNLKD